MSASLASRRRSCVVAVSLIGLSVAAGTPARAADDGYANVFSSVLGAVGIIKGDASPDIEYRERAPLVLPRSADLPKPAAGSLQHTAAWPQDPDVLRRRKDAAEARAPRALSPGAGDKGELLSKDEMMRGRAAGEPVRPNDCGNDGQRCTVVNPDVLKAEGERFRAANPEKSDELVAGKEPDREFLTQPPHGYLKPLKSVKATTEAPAEKEDQASPRYMAQQAAKRKAADE